MKQFIKCEIKCSDHQTWFDSPIFFGSPELYINSALSGNLVTCPIDGKLIPCNKENMRFQYRNIDTGKVFYEEGKDTFK